MYLKEDLHLFIQCNLNYYIQIRQNYNHIIIENGLIITQLVV